MLNYKHQITNILSWYIRAKSPVPECQFSLFEAFTCSWSGEYPQVLLSLTSSASRLRVMNASQIDKIYAHSCSSRSRVENDALEKSSFLATCMHITIIDVWTKQNKKGPFWASIKILAYSEMMCIHVCIYNRLVEYEHTKGQYLNEEDIIKTNSSSCQIKLNNYLLPSN